MEGVGGVTHENSSSENSLSRPQRLFLLISFSPGHRICVPTASATPGEHACTRLNSPLQGYHADADIDVPADAKAAEQQDCHAAVNCLYGSFWGSPKSGARVEVLGDSGAE